MPDATTSDLLETNSERSSVLDSTPTSNRGHLFRRIWKRLSLTHRVILAVITGALLGTALQDAGSNWHKIIVYPGELFIRLLMLVMVPLVALNMLIGVNSNADANAKGFGLRVLCFYLTTTFFAVAEGLVFANILRPGRSGMDDNSEDTSCSSSLAAQLKDVCEADGWDTDCDCLESESGTSVTVLDTFLQIGYELCPTNIVGTLLEGNIIGIISCFLGFGLALSYEPLEHRTQFLALCQTCLNCLTRIITVIVNFTPLGIGSLVAGEVARNSEFWASLSDLAFVVATIIVGFIWHITVFYSAVYWLFTRKNPYTFLWRHSEAFVTAFATSSSAATLPVTLRCLEQNGARKQVTQFIVPIGTTINMDGTAIYYPVAVIWISQMIGEEMSLGNQFAAALTSALVSIGSAPIPSAGLVYLLLIAETAGLDVSDTRVESLVALLWAIDWFLDRLQTVVNVMGDVVAAGVFSDSNILAQAAHTPDTHTPDTHTLQHMPDTDTHHDGIHTHTHPTHPEVHILEVDAPHALPLRFPDVTDTLTHTATR